MTDIRLKRITVEPLQSPLIIQRGDVWITNTTASNSLLEAALIINGGLSIGCITDSVSSTSGGAVTIGGGLSVLKSVFVGKDVTLDSSNGVFRVGGLTEHRFFIDNVTNRSIYFSPDGVNRRWELSDTRLTINITQSSTSHTEAGLVVTGGISIGCTIGASSETEGGALTIAGGVAIGKNVNIYSDITLGERFSDSAGITIRYTGHNQIQLSNSSGNNYSSINMLGDTLFVQNTDNISLVTSTGSINVINAGTTLTVFHASHTDFLSKIVITDTTTSDNSTTGCLVLSGGLSIANTSDAIDVNNGGSVTIAGGIAVAKNTFVGNTLAFGLESSRANKIMLYQASEDVTETESFTGFGNLDDSLLYKVGSTSGDHVFQHGSMSLFTIRGTNQVVFPGSSQSYSVRGGGLNNTGLSFVSETSAQDSEINFFTQDGSGSDSNLLNIYASGSFASHENAEYISIGWDSSDYTIRSMLTGTGLHKNICIGSSMPNQIVIATDDTVYMYGSNGSNNSTTGAFVVYGGVSIGCTENSENISQGGALTIAGGVSVAKDMYIGEGLTFVNHVKVSSNLDGDFAEFRINSLSGASPRLNLTADPSSNVTYPEITLFSLGSDPTDPNNERLHISTTDTSYSISSQAQGTGVLRHIGLFTGDHTNQLVLHTSGNVGVQSLDPAYTLDVSGTLGVSGTVHFTASDLSTASSAGSVVISGGLSIDCDENSGSVLDGGSFTAAGGASIGKDMYIGGILYVLDETPSTSAVDGAVVISGGLTVQGGENAVNVGNGGGLTVAGGGSFGGDLWVGGSINGSGSSSTTFAYLTLTATDESINLSTGSIVTLGGLTIQCNTNATGISNGGSILTPGGASIGKDVYIGGNHTVYGVTNYRSSNSQVINFYDTINVRRFSIDKNASSHDFSVTRYDALSNPVESVFEIGNASGVTTFNNTTASNSGNTGAVVVRGGIAISATSNSVDVNNGGALTVSGGASIARNTYIGGNLIIKSTTNSNSVSTGSVLVAGGVGISGDVNVLGNTLIVGNLTVNGQTTTIETTNTTIKDNIFVLNSGPSGSNDSGYIIQRYQTDNDTGSGDVVADTNPLNITLPDQSGIPNTQIKLGTGASAVNNYYTGWWIRINTGFSASQTRRITAYNGTTRIATVSSSWTNQNPSIGETVSLYNKPYVGCIYNETNDRFDFGATVQDPGQTNVTFTDYIPISFGSGLVHSTQTSENASTGALVLSGGISINNTEDSSSSTSGGTFTTLGGASVAKTLRVGNSLYVNGANITPNPYDTYAQKSAEFSNNISVFTEIPDLMFDSSVWGFDLYMVARVVATTSLYVNFHIRGVQNGSGWEIVKSYVGDDTGIEFSITSAGQILYTTQNYTGFVSGTFKWRSWVN